MRDAHRSGYRGAAWNTCRGVLLATLLACHEDGRLAAPANARANARATLSLYASASSAGERVDVTLSYLRQQSSPVLLTSQTFDITGTGEQQLSVSIDLTACLADPEHAAEQQDACSVSGSIKLRNASGTTVDSSAIGPFEVKVGGTAQAAATLRAIGTVSVTTASSMFVGDVFNAQVVMRDRENVVLTGRAVTWSSGNSGVATVSAGGTVTAVAPGTTAISATSQGVTGSANVTVQNNMIIVSMSPAAAATGVSIEAPVQLTFSENINASTVTPATVFLSQSGNTVTVGRQVAGNVVTLTPSAPLTEFSSTYAVTVTTVLRGVTGNRLAANANSSFTTAFWDPSYAYRLTNSARGAGESLEIVLGTNSPCFMGPTGNSNGQSWYFAPIPSSSGYYSIQNVLAGSTRGLEGADAPGRCYLGGPPFTPGLFSGTMWKPVSAGALAPGRYYLQNFNFGAAKSLDTPIDSGVAAPKMIPTANTPGQFWLFTRLFHM